MKSKQIVYRNLSMFFGLIFVALVANGSVKKSHKEFVKVSGTHFELAGSRYYFMGTNFWYGMNLGKVGAGGDPRRLTRELDRLHKLGVNNLRIFAGSEGPDSEPWRIKPSLQVSPGVYNYDVLVGLDSLLVEMSKRNMHAVVCLGNFWPWTGGMAQYLRWAGAGPIPYPPPEPGGDWGKYQQFTQSFYSNEVAQEKFRDFIGFILKRTNSLSKIRFVDDQTIISWELANEPRGIRNAEAFNEWIDETSSFIKSIDRNHLVTTGSEGETASAFAGMNFVLNHSFKNIDYATIHVWAQNWGWFDPNKEEETFSSSVEKMKSYMRDHIAKAEILGKPLVLEEFGLARDGGSLTTNSTVNYRDKYFSEVFQTVFDAMKTGTPMAGVNFWAWGGEGQPGSTWTGDPPHEPQGWYSVFKNDSSTLKVIENYSDKILNLAKTHKF